MVTVFSLSLCNSEHSNIRGFECLFAISGFSKVQLQTGFLPISLVSALLYIPPGNVWYITHPHLNNCILLQVKEPKVFILGNIRNNDVMNRSWPGCSWFIQEEPYSVSLCSWIWRGQHMILFAKNFHKKLWSCGR